MLTPCQQCMVLFDSEAQSGWHKNWNLWTFELFLFLFCFLYLRFLLARQRSETLCAMLASLYGSAAGAPLQLLTKWQMCWSSGAGCLWFLLEPLLFVYGIIIYFISFPPPGWQSGFSYHPCNTIVWPCVCVSLREALQEPSRPELPLYSLSLGRGGGRGPRGDWGTTHSSPAWGAEEWVTL